MIDLLRMITCLHQIHILPKFWTRYGFLTTTANIHRVGQTRLVPETCETYAAWPFFDLGLTHSSRT
jgi:hypothetical protein